MKPIERTPQTEDTTEDRMRDALIEAGYALAEELHDPEEWPTDLRDTAKRMIQRLRTGGSIPKTVESMDLHTVLQLAMEIKLLAADIEVLRIKGLVRSMSEQDALASDEDRWYDPAA